MGEETTARDTSACLCEMHYVISAQYEMHRRDPQLIHKLSTYVSTIPSVMSSYKQSLENRSNARKQAVMDVDHLIQVFMKNNCFYYNKRNKSYIHYDMRNYCTIDDDDVMNRIQDYLSAKPLAISLKIHIRACILKHIKQLSILNAVPESGTIQSVLRFLMANGITKTHAKYFLVIVGDNIHKKQNLSYYFPSCIKRFLHQISHACYFMFGCDATTTRFKFKYREANDFSDCRVLYFMRGQILEQGSFDCTMIHNMVCVALYYSSRYKSGDEFISHKADVDLRDQIYYLRGHSGPESIIRSFMSSTLQSTDNGDFLTMKNICFLWKRYCEQIDIPSVSTQLQLKNVIATGYQYNPDNDNFVNVTSPHIPIITSFITFWNESTVVCDVVEYEIEEVCMLFKSWLSQHNTRPSHVSETFVLKIVQHFYKDVVTIECDKYIYGVMFQQWKKLDDIERVYQTTSPNSRYADALYGSYTKFCEDNSRLIASKRFFESIVSDMIDE